MPTTVKRFMRGNIPAGVTLTSGATKVSLSPMATPSYEPIDPRDIDLSQSLWNNLSRFGPDAVGKAQDLAIVNAARVSFLGESKGTDRDKKLLFYLLQHKHTSPFEMCVFKMRVHAPLITW